MSDDGLREDLAEQRVVDQPSGAETSEHPQPTRVIWVLCNHWEFSMMSPFRGHTDTCLAAVRARVVQLRYQASKLFMQQGDCQRCVRGHVANTV